ncbi:hypothetical protein GCM10025865_16680 [Paraoerskovia sediminicola]|uniref:Urease accessory protein n=1 Tax=Paraoerskovia sediminicola TaxID=1138587 RepID=A0ABM8G2S7_9CELL|nr:urease accessory protein UreD [Paraoerskovia sediminicola]BDZ42369.1 hypothetical protein GCM10025865_16680 [Paraoerskovia sediminicola]
MTSVRLTADSLDLRDGDLALRVLGRSAGRARVGVLAGRMLLLGGDEVELDVEVEAGCRLDLVEIAGTVAHHGRGRSAAWRSRVRVGADAVLTWAAEPFVVSDGADVVRSLDVEMSAGSRAVVREVLVLGRSGQGGGALRSRTRVRLDGAPLHVEDLDLRDAGLRASPAVLGAARVVDTLSCWGFRDDGDPLALQLEGPGTVERYLGRDHHESPLSRRWAPLCAAASA